MAVRPKLRAAFVARFVESISSHLNTIRGIRYPFDVSEDALEALGEARGLALSNVLREQLHSHRATSRRR